MIELRPVNAKALQSHRACINPLMNIEKTIISGFY